MARKSIMILLLAALSSASNAIAQKAAPKKGKEQIVKGYTPPVIKPDVDDRPPQRPFADTCFTYTEQAPSDTGGWIFKKHELSFSSSTRITTYEWYGTDSLASANRYVTPIRYLFLDGTFQYAPPNISFASSGKDNA